jgi:hypothetical protein
LTSDQSSQVLNCDKIALRAKPADNARGNPRNEGMMTKFFPLVDIQDMHLKDWKFAGAQGVEYRHRGMGKGGRIDYHARGALTRFVNPVDQLKLGVGLAEFDVQVQL